MNAIDALEYTKFTSAIQQPSFWQQVRSWWRKDTKSDRTPPETDPATYSPCTPENRLREYRMILEDARSIYVFRNGTAVFSADVLSEGDAVQVMQEHGAVVPGTVSADFRVATIDSPVAGLIVKYVHPAIVSFESREEYPPELYVAGMMIRMNRHMDSFDLHVVAKYVSKS